MKDSKRDPNRIARINSLVQQVVGEAILPYLENAAGLTTVSKVETSRDMRWTKIWISIVNGDDKQIMHLLHKNIYHIQGYLNEIMAVKIVPRIQFFLDTSPRYAQRIDQLINQIHQEQ